MNKEPNTKLYNAVSTAIQNEVKLKNGDYVTVTRISKKGELGWNNTWTTSMNANVGKRMRILNSNVSMARGITLEDNMSYPIFVLQPDVFEPIKVTDVTPEYNAYVQKDGSVKVGCQDVSYDKLKELYYAASKQHDSYVS